MTNDDRIEAAREAARRYHRNLDELRGKRIRVLRAIEYEGEAVAVFRQIASSKPPGEHAVAGAVIIRIVEAREAEVIG